MACPLTDEQVEWHMSQLRNFAKPDPWHGDFLPCMSVTVATAIPLQQEQTSNDFGDFGDFNYDSYPLDASDDVPSRFCETPSSSTDMSVLDMTDCATTRYTAFTSQSPALLKPPLSEVDALMKAIQSTATGTSRASSVSSSSNVKKHLCPISDCGKAFSQFNHLEVHLRSHTGEKPYKCSMASCRQSFAQLGNLRVHERRHFGQQPNRKADLKTFTQRYECVLDDCRIPRNTRSQLRGKGFTLLGNLKAHMNKFHRVTLTKLSQRFAQSEPSDEDQELRQYFSNLYKNSNPGIKGRGKGRKVELLLS